MGYRKPPLFDHFEKEKEYPYADVSTPFLFQSDQRVEVCDSPSATVEKKSQQSYSSSSLHMAL
jgi:hypothetical protein